MDTNGDNKESDCKDSICNANNAHIYRDEIKSLIKDLNKIASPKIHKGSRMPKIDESI